MCYDYLVLSKTNPAANQEPSMFQINEYEQFGLGAPARSAHLYSTRNGYRLAVDLTGGGGYRVGFASAIEARATFEAVCESAGRYIPGEND